MASGPSSPDDRPSPPFAVELSFPAGDFQADWRRCNMAANYLAGYVAYQFAEREWAENLISTVTNEVLEAVALLSPSAEQLDLRCRQRPDDLLIEVEHAVRPELDAAYAGFLADLHSRDSAELYFELLTAAARPALAFNQFGLALIAHDFKADLLGGRVEPSGRLRLTIRVPNRQITGEHRR